MGCFPPPRMKWYINNNGAAEGPFDEATLTGMARDRDLLADTLVWHPEMADWVTVQEMNPLWWISAFEEKKIEKKILTPAPAVASAPAKKAPKPVALPTEPAAKAEGGGLFKRLFGLGKKKE